jgi:hypothetical protein
MLVSPDVNIQLFRGFNGVSRTGFRNDGHVTLIVWTGEGKNEGSRISRYSPQFDGELE